MSMIDYEITYPSSPRFVFHDSRGIEAGAESDCHGTEAGEGHDSSKLRKEYIQKFINDRAKQRRLGDQLHAIWFCMPMDTPRVPSDEFELAFLENVNHNVPVIAVLTKYEALVDRVKGEYKGRQVAKSNILNYAKMNVFDPLKNVTHVPAAIIQTHHKGKGCELLTKKTFEAINDETLATIFAMAQQNSIKLACQQIFKLFKFKDKLKMAIKTNDIADLYEDFIDMSLRFLPFWNMFVSCHLCLLLPFDITHIIFILISLLACELPSHVSCDLCLLLPFDITHIIFILISLLAFVCLIGCFSLQYSKTPWKHVTEAIKRLDNEGIRSHFLKDLEVLLQKHKYGSEEFCLKLADLIVGKANMC
ncbi:hypothetical protein F5888DRAFT_1941069 [Russula emetica]|nr:hypothetical protein F5888DRAFT_1941069 [Russula emetica]